MKSNKGQDLKQPTNSQIHLKMILYEISIIIIKVIYPLKLIEISVSIFFNLDTISLIVLLMKYIIAISTYLHLRDSSKILNSWENLTKLSVNNISISSYNSPRAIILSLRKSQVMKFLLSLNFLSLSCFIVMTTSLEFLQMVKFPIYMAFLNLFVLSSNFNSIFNSYKYLFYALLGLLIFFGAVSQVVLIVVIYEMHLMVGNLDSECRDCQDTTELLNERSAFYIRILQRLGFTYMRNSADQNGMLVELDGQNLDWKAEYTLERSLSTKHRELTSCEEKYIHDLLQSENIRTLRDAYNMNSFEIQDQNILPLGVYSKSSEGKSKIYEIYLLSDSYSLSISHLIDSDDSHKRLFMLREMNIAENEHDPMIDKKYKNIINGKMSHEIKTPCIAMSHYLMDLENWLLLALEQTDHQKFLSVITKLKSLTEQIFNVNFLICDYLRSISECDAEIIELSLNEQIDWGYWYLKAVLGSEKRAIEVEVEYNGLPCDQDKLGPKLLLEEEPDEIEVLSDPTKLKLILSELLKNSLKYTTNGKISLAVQEAADHVQIQIKDTGKGIDESRLSELNSILLNIEIKYKSEHLQNSKLSDIVTAGNFVEAGGLDIGLQLVKIYCLKLDIKFSIESESGKGFSAILQIPKIPKFETPVRKNAFTTQIGVQFKYSKVFSPIPSDTNTSMKDKSKTQSYNAKFDDLLNLSYNKFLSKNRSNKSSDELAIIEESYMEEFAQEDSPLHTINVFNSRKRKYLPEEAEKLNKIHTLVKNKTINRTKSIEDCQLQSKVSLCRNLTRDSSMRKDMEYILVVDDDYMCRKNLKSLIKAILRDLNKNIGVIKAADGLDSLNYIVRDQSHNCQIKMIVSDENMSFLNGSDSFIILNRMFVRKKLMRIPMVILTALEDLEDLNKMKSSGGISEIVKKPVNKSLMRNLIKRYFIY